MLIALVEKKILDYLYSIRGDLSIAQNNFMFNLSKDNIASVILPLFIHILYLAFLFLYYIFIVILG